MLRPDRDALALLAGAVLLSAALFGPVGVVAPEYRYEVTELAADDPSTLARLGGSDRTLVCPDEARPTNRDCAFERAVRDRGEVVVAEPADQPRREYRVVLFESGSGSGVGHDQVAAVYRVDRRELSNGSVAYDLERLTPAGALAAVAVPVDHVSNDLVRVVEAGTLHTTTELSAWEAWDVDTVVAHEGSYYAKDGFAYRGAQRRTEVALRGLLAMAGAVGLLSGRS